MICNVIFKSALGLIGDSPTGERTEDYAERAPYILASLVCDLSRLDRRYREAFGLPLPEQADLPVSLALSEVFPLCDRFRVPAENYLASMLVADEDADLSDKFYDRFCVAVTKITAEIPAVPGKIKNSY